MSRVYLIKKNYIDNLQTVLEVRDDFKKLEYHRHREGKEYLFMYLVTGDVEYFDITGLAEPELLRIVSQMVCEVEPPEHIRDNKLRLEIGKYFN